MEMRVGVSIIVVHDSIFRVAPRVEARSNSICRKRLHHMRGVRAHKLQNNFLAESRGRDMTS